MEPTEKLAADPFFDVWEYCPKLKEIEVTTFHNHVANLLFATKWVRTDIHTLVEFINTQARFPDKDK